jgi:hypothetical protein
LLTVRHFAGHVARLWYSLFFLFSGFSLASRLHCFLASVFDKENNNDANGSVRDCLEESETPSTSATLGAGHEGFSNGSLFASGIDFHTSGILLGHDIELGNTLRWSSRLGRVAARSSKGLLLTVRRFAEACGAILMLSFFRFSGFGMASHLHCSLALMVEKEGPR